MIRLFAKLPRVFHLSTFPLKKMTVINHFKFSKSSGSKVQKKMEHAKEKSEVNLPDEIDFSPFERSCETVFKSFESEVKNIKIGKLTPDLFKTIFMSGKDSKQSIYDVAQIIPVDAVRCNITPFDQSQTKTIFTILEKNKFHEFEVKFVGDDVISVSIPVGSTKEKKNKLIKMIAETGDKHKEKLRDARHQFLKSQEKYQKFLSKDVVKNIQKEMDAEFDKSIHKLEKMIKDKEGEFR